MEKDRNKNTNTKFNTEHDLCYSPLWGSFRSLHCDQKYYEVKLETNHSLILESEKLKTSSTTKHPTSEQVFHAILRAQISTWSPANLLTPHKPGWERKILKGRKNRNQMIEPVMLIFPDLFTWRTFENWFTHILPERPTTKCVILHTETNDMVRQQFKVLEHMVLNCMYVTWRILHRQI